MTGRRSLQWLAVVAVVAMAASGCGGGDEGTSGGEVIREPVDEVGPDPFTESVAEPVSAVTATTLVAAGVDGSDLGSVRGSSEAVYGGSLDEGECDADRLVGFLEENPDKAEAWASVQGIAVSGIAGFVADLTPMVLRQDTRVTNHGFRDGRATPRQSVFEAGTAVLVDQRGVPRVRCGCGNPLAEPEPTATAPRFTGPSWSGFQETTLVVIIEGATVNQFTLVDVDTDERFVRPAGTSGDQDDLVEPEPPPTTSTTEPPPPPTTSPPPPPTTAPPPPPPPEPVVASTPEEAARLLMDAVNAGDRELALNYGTAAVVDELLSYFVGTGTGVDYCEAEGNGAVVWCLLSGLSGALMTDGNYVTAYQGE